MKCSLLTLLLVLVCILPADTSGGDTRVTFVSSYERLTDSSVKLTDEEVLPLDDQTLDDDQEVAGGLVLDDSELYTADLATSENGIDDPIDELLDELGTLELASTVVAAPNSGGKKKGGRHAHGHPMFEVYGEALYLRPRNVKVAYAAPFNGPQAPAPAAPPVQIGAFRVADFDYEPAFSMGFAYLIDSCSKIRAEYTMYEADGTDGLGVAAPAVIAPLVAHPATSAAAVSWLQVDAQYDSSYDQLDIVYQKELSSGNTYRLDYLGGVRFAQHEQVFEAIFAAGGSDTITTDIDFYGAGLQFGLDGEWNHGSGLFFYSNLTCSLLGGEFRTSFSETPNFGGAPDVVTSARDGRLVSNWELEAGVAWEGPCKRWSLRAGYFYSAWTHMIQTDEWIEAVHLSSPIDMADTITYDGLVGRIQARF